MTVTVILKISHQIASTDYVILLQTSNVLKTMELWNKSTWKVIYMKSMWISILKNSSQNMMKMRKYMKKHVQMYFVNYWLKLIKEWMNLIISIFFLSFVWWWLILSIKKVENWKRKRNLRRGRRIHLQRKKENKLGCRLRKLDNWLLLSILLWCSMHQDISERWSWRKYLYFKVKIWQNWLNCSSIGWQIRNIWLIRSKWTRTFHIKTDHTLKTYISKFFSMTII